MVSRPRDPLPIPTVEFEPRRNLKLPRGCRQRISKRNAVLIRSAVAVAALSDIYGPQCSDLSDCMNLGMSSGIDRIGEAFKTFDPSLTETTDEALSALLGSSVPYDGNEESQTLAPFKRGSVALPGVFTEPALVADLVDSRAKHLIEGFQKELLHDARAVASII